MMIVVLIAPCWILFSFAIATWAGKHKKIGFWWAFFFGLTLTPLTGYMFAMLSGINNKRRITRYIMGLVSVASVYTGAYLVLKGIKCMETWGCVYLLAATGLAGIYVFLLKQLLHFNKTIPDSI